MEAPYCSFRNMPIPLADKQGTFLPALVCQPEGEESRREAESSDFWSPTWLREPRQGLSLVAEGYAGYRKGCLC